MANNQIALLAQAPQLDTPLESQGKALQLRQLMNAGQESDLQLQQARQGLADMATQRSALQADPTGGEGYLRALATGGAVTPYFAAKKANLDYGKTGSEIGKNQAETGKFAAEAADKTQTTAGHQFEIAGQLAGAWAANPQITKPTIQAGLAAALNSGIISPQIAQSKLAELDAVGNDPASLNAWAKATQTQVMTAQQQHDNNKPVLGTRNLGGTLQNIMTDPNTGKITVNDTSPITQSADNAATNTAHLAGIGAQQAGENSRNAATIKKDLTVAGVGPNGVPSGDMQSMIDAIGQGKMAPPNGMALRNPRIVSLMSQVAQQYAGQDAAHPMFDATAYGARQQAAKAFSTGKDGQAVQSANTALNHLDTLRQLADAQANGQVQVFNRLANYLGTQTGSAAPTDLQGAITMVGPEISKAVVGSGGTGGDRDKVDSALNAIKNGSPSQAAGQIATMQDLFGGRLSETARTYQRTTGNTDFSNKFLSPAAQAILAKRQPIPNSAPVASSVAVPPTNSQGWVLHKDAQGNQAYVSPDGKSFQEVK